MIKKIDEREMAVMDDSQEEREIVDAYEKGELIFPHHLFFLSWGLYLLS
jgi:hypothetical protein